VGKYDPVVGVPLGGAVALGSNVKVTPGLIEEVPEKVPTPKSSKVVPEGLVKVRDIFPNSGSPAVGLAQVPLTLSKVMETTGMLFRLAQFIGPIPVTGSVTFAGDPNEATWPEPSQKGWAYCLLGMTKQPKARSKLHK